MDGQITSRGALARRFRGFLPVIVDVETGGFDPARHALLEIAVQPVWMDESGALRPGEVTSTHVIPHEGGELDPRSLAVTGIDPHHPLRAARQERAALDFVFKPIRTALQASGCQRAILVGHNAHFDLAFVNAAVKRTAHKRNPFHAFSAFDTATLAGLAFGQTVLSRALGAAGLDWNSADAHSARYDAERTSELFCAIVNRWKDLGGWLSDDPAAGAAA
jgi:ribonuclease T